MTIYITAKSIIAKTKTKAIKTSPLQRPTLHLFPMRIVQGYRLVSAPLGQLSHTSLAIALENQICLKLDDIKYTYTINFT